MADIEFTSELLDNFIKTLKSPLPTIKIGVLAGNEARTGSGDGTDQKVPSNADIAAAHEFGTSKLPRRSFLRVPLEDHLVEYVEKAGGMNEDVLKEVIRSNSIMTWMKKIAVIAENVVAEGFRTGGFGKWKPHAPGYTNNTGQILVDTQQLRDSISSEVK